MSNHHPVNQTNERGHLVWGGCDVTQLARQFGTPAYVMDESIIVDRLRQYQLAAARSYPDLRIAYAGKAFLCGAMAKLVAEHNLWLDVVSGGELYVALAAGFPAAQVVFHGNSKSLDEIAFGLEAGVGRIVVDNLGELRQLAKLAAATKKTPEILLRITPGISPHTHRSIQTGQVDSKFGFPLADGIALQAIREALSLDHVALRGLHSHIGSQIGTATPFAAAARALAGLAWSAWRETGYLAEEINLGGGWAAGKLPANAPPPIEHYVASLTGAFRRAWRRQGQPGVPLGRKESARTAADRATDGPSPKTTNARRYAWPTLYVEPGRSIVADAGITLYTVGTVKPVPGHDPYVLVDGGMTDNPRPGLYGAAYRALVANRADAPATGSYNVAGKACESGDILIRGIPLADPRPGDLIAVLATGAYNHSMASNYNRFGRPPVVFAHDGDARLVVRRETFEDLIATDLETVCSPTSQPKLMEAPRQEVAAARQDG